MACWCSSTVSTWHSTPRCSRRRSSRTISNSTARRLSTLGIRRDEQGLRGGQGAQRSDGAVAQGVSRSARRTDAQPEDSHHRAQHGQPRAGPGIGTARTGTARAASAGSHHGGARCGSPRVSQACTTLVHMAERITLYASGSDKVLQLAKQLERGPRAGDANPVLTFPGMAAISTPAWSARTFSRAASLGPASAQRHEYAHQAPGGFAWVSIEGVPRAKPVSWRFLPES